MKRTYTNRRFLDALEDRVLIYDGAMGTSLQAQGLTAEHFGGERYNGCNDCLVLSYPQAVEKVHRSFLEAGVDVIETDTFRANRLTLGIYPEEKITLTFQTKTPGARVSLRSVTMAFHYHQGYEGPILDAYEKVLLDVMLGDHMLFWRQDGVELCWAFLSPILEGCESCSNRAQMLLPYESGTWGPDAARNLLEKS
mgnify:CR=1 FL=1